MASYLGVSLADLTQNGIDLGLVALNHVRRQAEMSHDFEFSRKLVQLAVDGETGGSLSNAVLHSDGVTAVNVKSIIEVGLFDDDDNLRPVEWTTVSESLERQRKQNPRTIPRYPTDGWARSGPVGQGLFEFSGTDVFRFPKDTENDFTLGMEVYTMQSDWTGTVSLAITGATGGQTAFNTTYYQNGEFSERSMWLNRSPLSVSLDLSTGLKAIWNLAATTWIVSSANDIGNTSIANFASATTTATTPAGLALVGDSGGTLSGMTLTVSSTPTMTITSASDVWLTYGSEYLLWAGVVELNTLFREFVPRQEGNLPPPTGLAAAALQAFKDWDAFRYEQNRRHGR